MMLLFLEAWGRNVAKTVGGDNLVVEYSGSTLKRSLSKVSEVSLIPSILI